MTTPDEMSQDSQQLSSNGGTPTTAATPVAVTAAEGGHNTQPTPHLPSLLHAGLSEGTKTAFGHQLTNIQHAAASAPEGKDQQKASAPLPETSSASGGDVSTPQHRWSQKRGRFVSTDLADLSPPALHPARRQATVAARGWAPPLAP